jgi:hypothetical protein
MDSKLIQGLLLASCVLLLFASLVTWFESTQYKGAPPAPAAITSRPAPAVQQPAAQPAQPVEEAPAAAPAETTEGAPAAQPAA